MKTMTIRNIPDEAAASVSGRATEEGCSINTMTVAILTPQKFVAEADFSKVDA